MLQQTGTVVALGGLPLTVPRVGPAKVDVDPLGRAFVVQKNKRVRPLVDGWPWALAVLV